MSLGRSSPVLVQVGCAPAGANQTVPRTTIDAATTMGSLLMTPPFHDLVGRKFPTIWHVETVRTGCARTNGSDLMEPL
jgi:hypothetical protein